MYEDNRDRIQIPLSLETTSTSRSSYFFSYKKGIWMALAILPSVIWVPFVASATPGRPTGLLIGLVTYLIAFIYFLRFVIFEELVFRKIFRDLEKNKLSNHKYFWGIDRIDSNGIIHYKYSGGGKLRKGVVIKLIRATKIGRDESYEYEYRDTFRRMLKEILRKGMSVDIYDTLDDKNVPYNIVQMNHKLKKLEDELTRKIATEHVKNLALIAKNNKRLEVNYLTIFFDDPLQFKEIDKLAGDIARIAENSKFFKIVKILSKEEVERYIAHRLEINAFPAEEGYVDVEDFSIYGEVYRVFDEDGNEDWIESINPSERVRGVVGESEETSGKRRRKVALKNPLEIVKNVFGIEDEFGDIDLTYKSDWSEEDWEVSSTSEKDWVDTYSDEYKEDDEIISEKEMTDTAKDILNDIATKKTPKLTHTKLIDLGELYNEEDKTEEREDLIDLDSLE